MSTNSTRILAAAIIRSANTAKEERTCSLEALVAFCALDEGLQPGELIGLGTVPDCCGLELNRLLRPGDEVRFLYRFIWRICLPTEWIDGRRADGRAHDLRSCNWCTIHWEGCEGPHLQHIARLLSLLESHSPMSRVAVGSTSCRHDLAQRPFPCIPTSTPPQVTLRVEKLGTLTNKIGHPREGAVPFKHIDCSSGGAPLPGRLRTAARLLVSALIVPPLLFSAFVVGAIATLVWPSGPLALKGGTPAPAERVAVARSLTMGVRRAPATMGE
mmetsp:Transcript_26457/g.74074  ORF Transcript_26457/g.74074 Transcript_26457/m.74074 type:complete len:272 (+) Transcript_26457:66-881(+)|eukprot:scaffold197272_cov31-Tisochrysis_lutea.AAC.3